MIQQTLLSLILTDLIPQVNILGGAKSNSDAVALVEIGFESEPFEKFYKGEPGLVYQGVVLPLMMAIPALMAAGEDE